jgi:hypothetical protein
MKQKWMFGLLVVLGISAGIGVYIVRYRPPALEHGAACNLPTGTRVEVEGYLFPNNRYVYQELPRAASDSCQSEACYLTLFSSPQTKVDPLTVEMPISRQNQQPYIGMHGELHLPLTIPIKKWWPGCLHPNTKFRVAGTIDKKDKTTSHSCMVRQITEVEVVDNPAASCGP